MTETAGKSYAADYLVMHLAPWKTLPDAEVEWPDVAACLPAIEMRLGAPVYLTPRSLYLIQTQSRDGRMN